MTISVGDKIPDVKLMTMTSEGPTPVRSGDALGQGKVVLFAVPGAFTPTCSEQHLPGFVARADDIRAKGVDAVACVAVNDAFVMDAWGRDRGADGLTMLADGNAELASAMGLEMDGSAMGLGTRSKRYAAVIEDGVVQHLLVEESPGLSASTAEEVLARL